MESGKQVFVPKRLTNSVIELLDCVCVESFEILCKDYLNYYAMANVIGKHVVPSYEDNVLVRDFDFDMFTKHYGDFFEYLDYVNNGMMGDYVCKMCKVNYIVPYSDVMLSSFDVMKTCYRKII